MEGFEFIMSRLDDLDEKLSNKLISIEIQTTRTNGRVSNHDDVIKNIQKDIEPIKRLIGFNRGRDWVVIAILGAMSGFFISYTFGGGRQREIEQAIEKYKIENQIKTK